MPPPMHMVTMPYFDLRRRHFVDQLRGQLRARASQRMTECDRAAVDIDLSLVHFQGTDNSQRLCGKGFVQFYQVNVVQRKPGQLRAPWGWQRSDRCPSIQAERHPPQTTQIAPGA